MANDDEAQFVTLGIEHETFAVPVDTVREIVEMRPMFRIPEAPPHVAGLIDIRGQAVPVIDLRVKLGLPAIAPTDATRILVLDVPMRGRRLALGLIADRVFEVAGIQRSAIGAPPDIGSGWQCDYIQGVARRGDRLVVIFDLSRLLSTDDAVLLAPRPPLTETLRA